MEVDLPRLALQQPHVHGLLGQRALRRRDEPREGSAEGQPHGAALHSQVGVAAPEDRSEAAAQGGAPLPDGAGGRTMPGAGRRGSGAREAASASFGAQGEGAIEGVYTAYIVGALGEHAGTRFNRFSYCRASGVEEAFE